MKERELKQEYKQCHLRSCVNARNQMSQIPPVSQQLGNISRLKSIGLGGNEIHDDGAMYLASALRSNMRLESLGLGGNLIGRSSVIVKLVM